jgi:internalin A
LSNDVKGDANYLLETLGESNMVLHEALKKVIQFADDTKSSKNSGNVKEKGWGRKLKSVIQALSSAGGQFKNIQDGGEALKSILNGLKELALQFNLKDIIIFFEKL